MTNENQHPAVTRLLALGPLPPQMSAAAAAEFLGGGPMQIEYILRMVAQGDIFCWTHSPSIGAPRSASSGEQLPRIAPGTDPALVLVDGEDVLWHFCLLLEEAIQGRTLPPKATVEARFERVRALLRAMPCAIPAPAEPPQAAPAESSASSARKRRTSWMDTAGAHIADVMRAGQYATAKELFRVLEDRAGPNSPFDRGQGANRGSLFVREIGQTLSLKTLQNEFHKLREMARNTAP